MSDVTPDLRSRAWEHAGLPVTAGAFALIALIALIALLATSGWDTQTAVAVIRLGGAADIALASVVASAGLAATVAVAYPIGLGALVLNRRGRLTQPWNWLAIVVVAAATLVLPWLLLASFAAYTLGAWVVGRRRRRKATPLASGQGEQTTDAYQWKALLTAISVFYVLALSTTPYLPREAISTSEGETLAGYVVMKDEDTLHFLTAGPRHNFGQSSRTAQVTNCVALKRCGTASHCHN